MRCVTCGEPAVHKCVAPDAEIALPCHAGDLYPGSIWISDIRKHRCFVLERDDATPGFIVFTIEFPDGRQFQYERAPYDAATTAATLRCGAPLCDAHAFGKLNPHLGKLNPVCWQHFHAWQIARRAAHTLHAQRARIGEPERAPT